MGEILFKAKTTKKDDERSAFDNVWVEGDLIHSGGKTYIHPISNLVRVAGEIGQRIIMHEVIPETVCRYTGKEDKKGKKIWEHDILMSRGNDKALAKVAFGEFYVIDAETLVKIDKVVGWHTEVIETDSLSKCEPFCLPMPLTDFYIKESEYE